MSLWNVGAQSIAPSQEKDSTSEKTNGLPYPRWQTILFWLAIVALFAIAIGMRLYDLGLPFDRDTYDEGVYWQSLRAMSAGHPLYQQIFYSQPPFFLLSTFPGYILFGGTLWSARFGIALVSLFGLLGVFLLGKALAGRLGAIAALLLIVVNPLYLQQSQTIQAEVSCVAFSLLSVGLAYLWWEHPEGIGGSILAGLAGMTLSLSILCKLFGIAALAPLTLSLLARLWLIWRRPGTEDASPGTSTSDVRISPVLAQDRHKALSLQTRTSASILPILVGIAACILTVVLVLLPFIIPHDKSGGYDALLQSVIFFHTDAGTVASSSQQGNISIIEHALYSTVTLAAVYGTLASLLRRDWRVLPLLAWLLVTIFLLWHQVPLFPHHLVILTPPLIALAVIGIGRKPIALKAYLPRADTRPPSATGDHKGPPSPSQPPSPLRTGGQFFVTFMPMRAGTRPPTPLNTAPAPTVKYTTGAIRLALTLLAILLILVTAGLDIRQDRQYYRVEEANSQSGLPQQEAGQQAMRAAADLRQAIAPDQLVVTDAQFIAALANRSTPPSLVDTSQVRISTGHLTLSQLIGAASEPQVHAVLFFTGRLESSQVAGFHDWVAHHFHLLQNYGDGRELWVR